MNTELLKSKLLEAAFNGSLTHADTSTWENTNIANIADVKGGKRIPAGTSVQKEPTSHVYLRVTDMKNFTIVDDDIRYITDDLFEGIKKYTISEDDLYLTIAGTIGRVGSIPHKYSGMSLTENAVKLTNIKIDRSYLMYYLASYGVQRRISLFVHQLAQPKLSIENIRSIHIQYPSLEEQRKLVATLEEGFAYIDAIASAKQNLSDTAELLRSKILQAAFDGSLTHADTSKWELVKLREVTTKIVDGDHNPPKGEEDPTPYIMLSSQNINDNTYVAMNKVRYLSKEKFDMCNKRTHLTKGDVLLTSVGTIGRSCVHNSDEVYCFQRSVTIITPTINSYFLKYYFDSPAFQQMLNMSSTGNAQKGFYLNKLKEVLIPLPSQEEQQRIVAKIEELFEQIDKITK